MTQPLSYEQVWGEPEDFNEDRIETDRAIEEIMEGDSLFDEAHYCPFCGKSVHLCQCDEEEFECGF